MQVLENIVPLMQIISHVQPVRCGLFRHCPFIVLPVCMCPTTKIPQILPLYLQILCTACTLPTYSGNMIRMPSFVSTFSTLNKHIIVCCDHCSLCSDAELANIAWKNTAVLTYNSLSLFIYGILSIVHCICATCRLQKVPISWICPN